MQKQLKKYYVDDLKSEVYAVSLVDNPAVMASYVAFNEEQKLKVQMADDEKRMVSGAVLRPDFPIYRCNRETGEEFYIEFSKKAVEKLASKFMHTSKTNNWTIDHEDSAEGVYAVESWIKIDNEHDKSIALGLDQALEIGTWFMTVKVDNDDVWQEIKNGRWKGFSVESMLMIFEKKINNHNMNKESNLMEKLRDLINDYFGDNAPDKTTDEAETVESVEMESVEEQAAEQPVEEAEVVEMHQEEEVAQQQEEVADEIENPVVADLEAKVADLEAKLAQAVDSLAVANGKIEELSKQPSAQPVNVKASAEEASVMDTIRALRDGSYFKK